MTHAKSGSRADREALRTTMSTRGCSIDEIASEMRASWGFGIRAAYRHANGLTLDQAADRCNAITDDADVRTTGSRISDWEGWPQSGRRPTAYNLVVLARVYGTLPRRLISPNEWDALDERGRLVLDEIDRQGNPSSRQEQGAIDRSTTSGIGPSHQNDRDQRNTARLTAAAARDALDFTNWAETTNVSESAIEHVEYELGRIAINFVHAPLLPLFRDMVELRGAMFGLLRNGRQRPAQARNLFFLAGTNCLLLAHASQNLGDSAAAMAQVRAALTCAEQADHDGLRAWTYGTAALIAEWTHQHRRAAEFAQRGHEFARTADSRVRLAALEARSAARAGDRSRALEALDRAAIARDTAVPGGELEEFGGLLTFPIVKQQYYAGSTYALLGDNQQAQNTALAAIGIYETGPQELRSYGDEALARIDVTVARLALGDLDGAEDALQPVLDLPTERRIEPVSMGMGRIRAALAAPRYARVGIARTLALAVDGYQAACTAQPLLSDR